MAYENYNIRQFINAWFKDDRSVITQDEFDIVRDEYVDTAGLYESEEFSLVGHIHYISNRLNAISLSIRIQRMFMDNFDEPYKEGFSVFKKHGYILYWNNREDFLKQISKIELKENKFISQLETKMNELKEKRLKRNKKEPSTSESRGSFIRTVNSLGKIGYKIDNDKTTVEELAYMIKQQSEENKKI